MSASDLSTLQDELESTTREYSEVLVEILALREELSFEKELNNQFISLLLSIQRKCRELETDRKKGKMTSKQKDASNIVIIRSFIIFIISNFCYTKQNDDRYFLSRNLFRNSYLVNDNYVILTKLFLLAKITWSADHHFKNCWCNKKLLPFYFGRNCLYRVCEKVISKERGLVPMSHTKFAY